MADQAKLKRRLEDLLRLPENQICADCGTRGPRWASVNLGVFVCLNCSGIHRSLGVHISFMRSVDLDTWQKEQVNMMEEWGNKRAAMYYEACVPSDHYRPGENASVREMDRWIRFKYERKQFIPADGIIPEPQSSLQEPQSQKEAPTRRRHLSTRLPRHSPTTPQSSITRAPILKQVPAPAPAPVVEASLIDFSMPDPEPVLPPTALINFPPASVASPMPVTSPAAVQVLEPVQVPPPAPVVDKFKLSADAILSMYNPPQTSHLAPNGAIPNPRAFASRQHPYQYQYQYPAGATHRATMSGPMTCGPMLTPPSAPMACIPGYGQPMGGAPMGSSTGVIMNNGFHHPHSPGTGRGLGSGIGGAQSRYY